MAKMAREESCTGLYHVMLRGADRRIIYLDDEDNRRFPEIMQRVKRGSMLQLYAYCLTGNHVHLLVGEGKEPPGMTFKRIGVSLRELSGLAGISKAGIERNAKMQQHKKTVPASSRMYL